MDTYRSSGPGGQRKNKISSAVRLRHGPTGLSVTAAERRSQVENRTRALRRLREAIALHQRNGVVADEIPAFYAAALKRDPALHVNRKHPDYWLIVQHILDVLLCRGGKVSEAAQALRISTGQLIRFMKDDPKLWEHAARMRRDLGLQPLR
jgi:hypothetical protein